MLLADGFHRVGAHRYLHRTEIEVEIREGTRRHAILHSREANSRHGYRFTTADKRRAILTYLRDFEWSMWPDREIARRLGIDPKTVGNHRRALQEIPAVGSDRKTSRGNSTPALTAVDNPHTASQRAAIQMREGIEAVYTVDGADGVIAEIVMHDAPRPFLAAAPGPPTPPTPEPQVVQLAFVENEAERAGALLWWRYGRLPGRFRSRVSFAEWLRAA